MTRVSTRTRLPWAIELPQSRRQRGVNPAANAYLSSAVEGMVAGLHNYDGTGLWLRVGLRDEQRALFAQSVGCPGTSGQADRP